MKRTKPRSLRWQSRLITRLIRPMLVTLARLKVSRVTVVGRENVSDPDAAFIVASNHISILDPVYLWGALRRNATAIAMKELWSWPVIGQLMYLMGHIPVDRGDRASGRRAIELSIKVLEARGVVMLYPEGGISKTEYLRPFKAGVYELAAATGAKVVPVGIIGSNVVKPAVAGRFNLRYPVVLTFGEAMDPQDFSGSDDFLTELARRISDLSGQKISSR